MNFFKKNFAIVIAFSLPILIIIAVAVSTYLPSIFLSTDYNFVYASCSDGLNYYYRNCGNSIQNQYTVVDGKIIKNPASSLLDSDRDGISDADENYVTHIFIHDTKKNESREISFEEASRLEVSNLLTSPDGVTVSSGYERNADFFLIFDGGSSYGHYLTKGKSQRKLNLINEVDRYYYRDNFYFLGWVLPARN